MAEVYNLPDYEKMTDEELFQVLWRNDSDLKYKIVQNMRNYAGSFVIALSECISTADRTNLLKLVTTFRSYINAYLPDKWENAGHPKMQEVVKEIFKQVEPFGVKEIALDGVRYKKNLV